MTAQSCTRPKRYSRLSTGCCNEDGSCGTTPAWERPSGDDARPRRSDPQHRGPSVVRHTTDDGRSDGMNPRAEAYERLGGRYETRVLEPSSPAVNHGPWFADDPLASGDVPAGRSVVSPVGTGDVRWEDLASADPELAEWCADRWLGPYRRLAPAPAALVPTRIALHRLAEQIVSPARRNANGRSDCVTRAMALARRSSRRTFRSAYAAQDSS